MMMSAGFTGVWPGGFLPFFKISFLILAYFSRFFFYLLFYASVGNADEKLKNSKSTF